MFCILTATGVFDILALYKLDYYYIIIIIVKQPHSLVLLLAYFILLLQWILSNMSVEDTRAVKLSSM